MATGHRKYKYTDKTRTHQKIFKHRISTQSGGIRSDLFSFLTPKMIMIVFYDKLTIISSFGGPNKENPRTRTQQKAYERNEKSCKKHFKIKALEATSFVSDCKHDSVSFLNKSTMV